ncbi:DUF6777 domain-containing protein [Streptomyces sp. CC224B]|uniref:DUF6777 domain-containing protein n=1 Tax=Streptomyces sp. CC224B TaxID=3044571 RepID=UPI0024A7E66B|nr:DUF6777 domain-containing protein [Streptomyces sp. CC224B]
MRAPIRTYATALAMSAALTAAGCSAGGGEDEADAGRELFLQPVAARGPDPFTASTAEAGASPAPVTRSPQPSPTGPASPTGRGLRSLAGGTPGLYGGTRRLGSCDVGLQVRYLTADRAKARAFARAAGVAPDGVAAYLRGLTPVVLRADTRVTNHGYRDGRATGYQAVLQAGTAVLVDDRGLPRVRCACGNPLRPPVAFRHAPRHRGDPWTGYRPVQVVVVTPAPRPVTHLTLVNIVDNTWIERRTGDHDAGDDRPVPPPQPHPTPSTDSPAPDRRSPDGTTPDEPPEETGDGPDPADPDTAESGTSESGTTESGDGTDTPDGGDDGTDTDTDTPGEGTTSGDCPTSDPASPEDTATASPSGCPTDRSESP